MKEIIPNLAAVADVFIESKKRILVQWISYESPRQILQLHKIDETYFLDKYASGVFDYFMGVISGEREIGNCPVMQELLAYLKFREISADELFEICSHFRRSMLDFSYDAELDSKELFNEISYIYDKNFRGILKFYTDTIFEKLIDARQEALQASQAKEYFLSNMSHEIRTPLNAILGFVNLLKEEDLSCKHKNYLDIVSNSGENLLSIINDILDFSKLRSAQFSIEPKIFSLHEELSHTMELFVPSANAKDITICSFIDPEIPKELFADALRIKQILSNFLSNAIKFTPKYGLINIEATLDNTTLKISVHDNGVGINEKDKKNIFTAFVQAQHSEQKNSGGTGLGLSICHQLAKHMQGHINVISELNRGSTFWVELPIKIHNKRSEALERMQVFKKLKIVFYAKNLQRSFQYDAFLKYAKTFAMNISLVDTLESDADVVIFVHEKCKDDCKNKIMHSKKKYVALMSKQYDDYDNYEHINTMCFPLYCSKIHTVFQDLLNPQTLPLSSQKVTQKFKGHILVAEDNETNQELIKILLMKYGLTFDLASNGLEALELYKKNTYDLILMDEQMPVMDGNETIKKILEHESLNALKHTPVSALTANVIKGARERGLLSGFDAFLAKPIVLKELERVFSTYLKIDFISRNMKKIEHKTQVKIVGLDADKLSEELMLNHEELVMLLELFIKKMQHVIPQLHAAIQERDFKKIAFESHSIKGSSANFRIEQLQLSASEMEKMAKGENANYDYEGVFLQMKSTLEKIKIS